MTQQEFFGEAKWISASVDNKAGGFLVRRAFTVKEGEGARIKLIGLGTFEVYLNGRRVSDDMYLPLNSEYEKTEFPVGEELYGFRIYVTEYDLRDYLVAGENVLVIHVGYGWYNGCHYGIKKIYGESKAIYSIELSGGEKIVSDGEELWHPSFVFEGDITRGESQDYNGWSDTLYQGDLSAGGWERVKISAQVESEYLTTDCPADKVARILPATKVSEGEGYVVYDCGENISGFPVIKTKEGYVGDVSVIFSEGLNPEGDNLDEDHIHWQHFDIKCDGKARRAAPVFTWLAFRYFRVSGECEVLGVSLVHADVKVDSYFNSDNEVLNWIYDAFVVTQLTNMHRGIPSDCPHIERLGYTGDGQNVCRSALMTLDAKEFYKKWIADISDCQDKLSGRVQYTAPFYFCGGGPGGWGCAITVVPYEYYKFYGDDTYIRQLYPQMLHFLKFLDDHSEYDVVTSFKEGGWCLGDWCAPEPWTLPTPFVNTYFRIKTTLEVIEIARIIGREEDIPALEADVAKCKKAVNTLYFNSFERDDTFLANTQGAAAYGLGIGLGTDVTKEKFIKYYDDLGHYDTGIFATELVTRRLFELGRADVAFKLLTADEPHGFGRWMKLGNTLREYWGKKCRSYSHPMFGAVIALFYEYILGIRQPEGKAGYREVVISPVKIDGLNRVDGIMSVPAGKIGVHYFRCEDGSFHYTVKIPEGVTARIEIPGIEPEVVGHGVWGYHV